MTMEIGRLCAKIAGRDAGKKALIVDIIDSNFVLIDGETRRRRCNIRHLEPLNHVLKIEKDATHGDVTRALKEIGIETRHTTPKQTTEKPKKKRKTPEQLRVQKEERKVFRGFFTKKKKEEKIKAKEGSLEEKAGLKIEELKEGIKEEKKESKVEKNETKS